MFFKLQIRKINIVNRVTQTIFREGFYEYEYIFDSKNIFKFINYNELNKKHNL